MATLSAPNLRSSVAPECETSIFFQKYRKKGDMSSIILANVVALGYNNLCWPSFTYSLYVYDQYKLWISPVTKISFMEIIMHERCRSAHTIKKKTMCHKIYYTGLSSSMRATRFLEYPKISR